MHAANIGAWRADEVGLSYLELESVSKSFGPFRALNDVSLTVNRGEIHALLGENGAGKTTLMNIVYGLYRPDSGRILIDGKPVVMDSPADAIANSIGMIHQHFQLANSLTVVENVVLGLKGSFGVDLRAHSQRIADLSHQYGFDVDPHAPIWKLPIGMRQRVDIVKALYRNAEILVLDEPTSVLAPDEISNFLDGLKRLRDSGRTILFITHKLDEVMAVSDRVAVMRRGKLVADIDAKTTTPQNLSKMMIGQDFEIQPRRDLPKGAGRTVLDIRKLSALDDRGAQGLKSVTLDLKEGEILGVTGVDGNGQRELAETIVGLRDVLSGDIAMDGVSIVSHSVRDRIVKCKIGFVPEDRHATGLVLDYSVASNLALRDFDRPPISRNGIINFRKIAARATDLIARYDIRLHDQKQPARTLSGGNQQKIILAREIDSCPRVLVVMQATKGLDVGAIAFVQNKILEERARGTAILYISTELEHVLEVSDRIAVMCAGRLSPILTPKEATMERIGMLMGGLEGVVA